MEQFLHYAALVNHAGTVPKISSGQTAKHLLPAASFPKSVEDRVTSDE